MSICTCALVSAIQYLCHLEADTEMQHIGQVYCGSDHIFRNIHALRACGHTQELPPIRVPFRQLQRSTYSRVSVVRLLVVSELFRYKLYRTNFAHTYSNWLTRDMILPRCSIALWPHRGASLGPG